MKTENFWERVLVEVASNSIKSIIVICVSAFAVVIAAIYNPLIDIVNKFVPKTILVLLPLTLLILLIISVAYIFYLRKKLGVELKQSLGVYWDKDLNTYCPACKKLLGNYAYYPTHTNQMPGFKCVNCKEVIRMSNGKNIFMGIDEAKEFVKNLFK
ncbi:MAG: hypothetical protein A2279_05540 [Stygiobacter sp. RIFOXYA12_FULL_38_9]|nr:MAG: hypothetical protein A2X62_16305 [Stygiobacter sp. GWC2_38_9]OGU83863.1 MAG: hypothetical protein A2279_05540 [Stygiobacter sp. RIFOXYA12_FULL_38_9]OGV06334.1 MAG: hypothetical protein A2299_13005 [Stygiobacter sp. RIFOXYB2_FULL_37_11]OGV11057.1 MAG: hypothetical protein A2237_04435 [Stygiobacter sp. RIFOXYA2_FULL_38_8]OGV15449.1 MAG: hypothetical protein A2440_00040 [Stygiobacter sp. RIFOXYC2_FULL_38_25]OGV80562.1 MAG: hypothetical protein A2X65_05090 [Stygiobacter sp. GWF2_38_21]RJQ